VQFGFTPKANLCAGSIPRQAQLRFPHLCTKWYSDTFFHETMSIQGYTCGQLFCNNEGWATIKPTCSKVDYGDKLNNVIHEYGIPKYGLHTDNAGEESGAFTEWERVRKTHLIPQTFIEPHSLWMNRAEGKMGRFKMHYRRIMNWWQCPETLWCFGALYTSRICELVALMNLNDRSAIEVMTGETPDISTFTNFNFYQFVIYYDPYDSDNDRKGCCKLAHWLGPSELVGQGLSYYLLKPNGRYIARSTVQPITSDNYSQYPTIKDKMKDFDFKVKEHIGIFDADLILQTEADDPEEVLFKPLGDGDTPKQDNKLDEEDNPDAHGFNPLI
jgi:hypothetical protein